MEIKNDFWSQGLILFIFFHSLKQCLQIIQVKASQKQNNIIKALLHTDTFSYAARLTVSLNPVWWESSCTLQGILLELFWLQQKVAKQNSLAIEMHSVLAPQSLIPSSVFIIHWDSIWEALGGAVTFPGASPTPPPAVQRSWPWGLEAWASPLSGWGLRSWEREGFHQEEFGRGASSSPCSSQNNTGQPHQIRPGLGDWGVLKKDRGSRERAREMFSWEISHSLFTLSVLWFESAK